MKQDKQLLMPKKWKKTKRLKITSSFIIRMVIHLEMTQISSKHQEKLTSSLVNRLMVKMQKLWSKNPNSSMILMRKLNLFLIMTRVNNIWTISKHKKVLKYHQWEVRHPKSNWRRIGKRQRKKLKKMLKMRIQKHNIKVIVFWRGTSTTIGHSIVLILWILFKYKNKFDWWWRKLWITQTHIMYLRISRKEINLTNLKFMISAQMMNKNLILTGPKGQEPWHRLPAAVNRLASPRRNHKRHLKN